MNKSIKHNLVCKRMNPIQNYAKSYLPDFVCFSRESIGYTFNYFTLSQIQSLLISL